MHRRATHSSTVGAEASSTNGKASTATSSSLTVLSGDVAGLPPPRSRRRRRKQHTLYAHAGRGSSLLRDEGVQCLMASVGLVAMLIGAGVLVIWHLMQAKNISLKGHPTLFQNSRPRDSTSGLHRKHHASKEEVVKLEAGADVGDDRFPPLEPSKTYTVPHSMSHIGDKSDHYARLRKEFDEAFPYDPERSLQAADKARSFPFLFQFTNPNYDVHSCPNQPPKDYPYEWSTRTVLQHWNPNDPTPPSQLYQGVCIFDYRKDYVKALNYRKAEVPFVVRGDPAVAATVERWNIPGYMDGMMGNVLHRTEYSENNHFLYWTPPSGGGGIGRRNPKAPQEWQAPTKMMRKTYRDWLSKANLTDDSLLGPDHPHWYFRLIGCGETGPEGECDQGSSEYLFDELTFFQPRLDQLYLNEFHKQKGIHCRFGMKGVIAENHFDASRNSIVVLGGARRYILSHPKNCPNFALYPKGHPSARHSQVDWGKPDFDDFPEFGDAMSNEVVLQAGDVLYLPTHWFHFIVSLTLNFQCNTRSGKDDTHLETIVGCGFD